MTVFLAALMAVLVLVFWRWAVAAVLVIMLALLFLGVLTVARSSQPSYSTHPLTEQRQSTPTARVVPTPPHSHAQQS